MKTLKATATYFTTVDDSHSIQLPESIPTGSAVAVIVMPSNWPNGTDLRQARFAAALQEIQPVVDQEPPPSPLSDQELNQLIRNLRKQMSSS